MSLILPQLMRLHVSIGPSCLVADDGRFGVTRGWGAVSYAANNTIVGNSCHDYKTLLNDGGCIYSTAQRSGRLFASCCFCSLQSLISLVLSAALSPQPGNLITENHCYNQGTPSSGALYPDEGSAYMTWQDNVVSHIGASKWA